MRRLTVLLLALLMSAAVVVVPQTAQADGPTPKRVSSGWLPYWKTSPTHPEGVTSAIQNADLFTDVSPFWFSATARNGGGVKVGFNPNFSNGAATVSYTHLTLPTKRIV